MLLRAAIFMFFANGIWTLLPLTSRKTLHLGSDGYGLLLGCVGVGAVAGAVLLPRLRTRLSPGVLVTSGSFGVAGLALVLASVHVTGLVALALVVGRVAWILVLSTLNSVYQSTLPGWVKARGMAYYLIVFQGGGALGAAALGVAAQEIGLTSAMLAVAAGLAVGALVGLALPFMAIAPADLLPAGDWPAPQLLGDEQPEGPVMVTIEYRPRPGLEHDLLAGLYAARWSRRRTAGRRQTGCAPGNRG